ncbi:DsbA family protein [Ornithinimicrobium sp. Y1847]|uniref:DsbA family protein n=1 Tax=unclassified Ornithinimicrobium TaxID=2615080 RepID=UPI003B6851A0
MPRPPAPEVKPVSQGPSSALIGGVVVLVVALIGVLVWLAIRSGDSLESSGSANALSQGGGISSGPGVDAGDGVTQVHVYGDFQCPFCGDLEVAVGEELEQKVEAGEVNLTVTLMSFLDGRIAGENSARAANAALCADDAGAFLPFYQDLYTAQPQEGQGWSDEQLVATGEAAGITGGDLDTFSSCVAERPYQDYVDDMQQRANQDGVTGTPRMFVNGTQISDDEMRGLMERTIDVDTVLATHS